MCIRDSHSAAQALGNPTELRDVPGADHFTIVHELERSDSPMAQWLNRQLRA